MLLHLKFDVKSIKPICNLAESDFYFAAFEKGAK